MRWGISAELSCRLEVQQSEARSAQEREIKQHRLLVEVSNWPKGMPKLVSLQRRYGDVDYLLMLGLVDSVLDPKLGDRRYVVTRRGWDVVRAEPIEQIPPPPPKKPLQAARRVRPFVKRNTRFKTPPLRGRTVAEKIRSYKKARGLL